MNWHIMVLCTQVSVYILLSLLKHLLCYTWTNIRIFISKINILVKPTYCQYCGSQSTFHFCFLKSCISCISIFCYLLYAEILYFQAFLFAIYFYLKSLPFSQIKSSIQQILEFLDSGLSLSKPYCLTCSIFQNSVWFRYWFVFQVAMTKNLKITPSIVGMEIFSNSSMQW